MVSDNLRIAAVAQKLALVRQIAHELFEVVRHLPALGEAREQKIVLLFDRLAHFDDPKDPEDDDDDDDD